MGRRSTIGRSRWCRWYHSEHFSASATRNPACLEDSCRRSRSARRPRGTSPRALNPCPHLGEVSHPAPNTLGRAPHPTLHTTPSAAQRTCGTTTSAELRTPHPEREKQPLQRLCVRLRVRGAQEPHLAEAVPRTRNPHHTVSRTTHLWHDNLGEAPHNAPGARKTTVAEVVCAAEGAGCAGTPPRRGGRPGPSPPRRTHAPHPAEAAERERPPPRPHEGRNGGRRPSGSGSRELTEHVLEDAAVAVVVGLTRGVDAHHGVEVDGRAVLLGR